MVNDPGGYRLIHQCAIPAEDVIEGAGVKYAVVVFRLIDKAISVYTEPVVIIVKDTMNDAQEVFNQVLSLIKQKGTYGLYASREDEEEGE